MISNRDDPHAVLGVGRTATPAQIGHVYRELLRRHHPDTRTPDDDNAHDRSPARGPQRLCRPFTTRLPRRVQPRPTGLDTRAKTEDTKTQPIVRPGSPDPPTTAAPTWIVLTATKLPGQLRSTY